MLNGVKVPSAYDPVTKQPIPDNVIPWRTATRLEGLGYTLSTNLVPTLAGELAEYGIVKLGEQVGLDPRISQLAGIPIKAGVSSFTRTGDLGQKTLTAISNGLAQGALQVGLSFATQGLDPLLGGLASATVTGAIEGLLSPADPNRPLDPKRKGIFAGIGDTVTRALGGFTEIGLIKPGDPLTTAQGLAKLNDFTNIVRDQGLGAAVETYATSLLYRSSVESLISAKNNFSIQQAINAQLADPLVVALEGRDAIQISLGNGKHLWVDPTTHDLIASLQGQDYIRYVAPPKVDPSTGTAAVTDAEITRTIPNPLTGEQVTAKIRLEAAGADWIEIEDSNGVAYRITPDNLNRLRLNSDGTVKDGILTNARTGDKFWFQNNQVVRSVEKKDLWALNPETGKAELQDMKAIVETSVDAQGNEHLTFRREDGEELRIAPTRLDFGKNSYLLIDEKGNQTVYYNGLQVVLGDLKLAAVVEIFQAIRSNPDQLPEQTLDSIADAVGRQAGGDANQQRTSTDQAKNVIQNLSSWLPGASLANTLVELNLVESLEPIVRIVQGMEIKTEYAGGIILHNPGETPYQLNFGEAKGITVSKKDKNPAGKIGPVDTYSFDSLELNVGGATDPAGGSLKVGAGAKTVLPFREGDADDVGLSFEAATDPLKNLVGKTNVSVKLKANNQYAFGKGQVTFTIDSEETDDDTELERDVRTLGIFSNPASQPLNYPPPAILNPGGLADFLARELTVGSPEFFGSTQQAMRNWIHELNERSGLPPSP